MQPQAIVSGAQTDPVEGELAPRSIPALVDHIVERYHRPHLWDLECAIELADQVEELCATDPVAPKGFADHLRRLAKDLDVHQQREETVLFPLLRIGTPRCLNFVMRRMMDDHADVDLQVISLQRFLERHAPSAGAPLCWQALAFLCRRLVTDLQEHARLENAVLFAALRA